MGLVPLRQAKVSTGSKPKCLGGGEGWCEMLLAAGVGPAGRGKPYEMPALQLLGSEMVVDHFSSLSFA